MFLRIDNLCQMLRERRVQRKQEPNLPSPSRRQITSRTIIKQVLVSSRRFSLCWKTLHKINIPIFLSRRVKIRALSKVIQQRCTMQRHHYQSIAKVTPHSGAGWLALLGVSKTALEHTISCWCDCVSVCV